MSSATPTEPVSIRRARAGESDALAELLRRVREQNVATIPPPIHPLADMRRWMREVVFTRYDVWAAECAGRLIGLLILGRPDWIEHLYIDAPFTGRGLGGELLEVARRELGGSVQLWTFQANVGARRFYERHGFVAVQTTGGDNEEGAPDVRYLLTR